MTEWKNRIRTFLHCTLGNKAVAATEKLVRSARHLRVEVGGAIEYMLHPHRRTAWGGAFNGQRSRQNLFHSLVEKFAPVAILETGTYLGTTTEFLAATRLPIFSVESDPHHYGFARARFWRFWRSHHVHLVRGDSREALRMWLDGPLRRSRKDSLFVYLDAHWGDNLPLAKELEIIFGACPNAIVMVDDFQVPADEGYGYDDYGVGRALTADYIEPIVAAHNLEVFYPSTPSSQETGARRGCVVIAGKHSGLALASLPLLRQLSKTPTASAPVGCMNR